MTNIEKLKGHAERLAALLSDPHPGLMTWRQALAVEINAIGEFSKYAPSEAGA